MKKFTSLLLSLSPALFIAGLAEVTQAAEITEANVIASEAEFIALDADKNGKLSKQEASIDDKLVTVFAHADTDQNGEISRMEYILFVNEPSAAGEKK